MVYFIIVIPVNLLSLFPLFPYRQGPHLKSISDLDQDTEYKGYLLHGTTYDHSKRKICILDLLINSLRERFIEFSKDLLLSFSIINLSEWPKLKIDLKGISYLQFHLLPF